MCVTSNVGDYWRDTFPQRYPTYPMPGGGSPLGPGPYGPVYPGTPLPYAPGNNQPFIGGYPPTVINIPPVQDYVTKEQFEELRKEMLELKELLLAAKKFDEVTGQKDCEIGDKVAFIRAIAEQLGVDMNDVFKE